MAQKLSKVEYCYGEITFPKHAQKQKKKTNLFLVRIMHIWRVSHRRTVSVDSIFTQCISYNILDSFCSSKSFNLIFAFCQE